MKLKINFSSDTAKKISEYLSKTSIEKISDEEFIVDFDNNLFKYDVKLADLMAYLIFYFNATLMQEPQSNEEQEYVQ
jgi:hypothetical protein